LLSLCVSVAAALDPSLAAVSYDHCVGYRPAHDPPAAAAAAAAGADEDARHSENVSHFAAVVDAAASGADSEGALRVSKLSLLL
jgi:hypothetical protein